MNFQDAMIEVSKGKMVVDPISGQNVFISRTSNVFFDFERTHEGLQCLEISDRKPLLGFVGDSIAIAHIAEESIASDGWQLATPEQMPPPEESQPAFVPAQFTLPTWEQANENIEHGQGTALDTFIVMHEPHTENQGREFREQLLAALIESANGK